MLPLHLEQGPRRYPRTRPRPPAPSLSPLDVAVPLFSPYRYVALLFYVRSGDYLRWRVSDLLNRKCQLECTSCVRPPRQQQERPKVVPFSRKTSFGRRPFVFRSLFDQFASTQFVSRIVKVARCVNFAISFSVCQRYAFGVLNIIERIPHSFN